MILFIIVLTILIGDGWLTGKMLDGLQTHPKLTTPSWSARNAIVVLGVGTVKWSAEDVSSHSFSYSRMFEALRLYSSCRSEDRVCKVIASGGDPSGTGVTEADAMARELALAGVAAADLIPETKSQNTFQNARYSSEILRAQNFDRVFLVTSGIHMARSLSYFAHFQINAVPAPSEHLAAIPSLLPLAYNFSFFDLALHERLGEWRYQIYQWFGWNTGAGVAGSV